MYSDRLLPSSSKICLLDHHSIVKCFENYYVVDIHIRDWSLITGRGGYKTGGGAREVLPLRKGGAEKVLAMLKGGHKKFWGSFYAVA